MQRIEKQVIAYTAIIHCLVHILELAYGVLLISIGKEFGIGFFVLGILANVFGFTFGLSALPFGYLADRTSEKRLLIICCLGMGISSAIIGLSPNIYILGIALSLLGLTMGIYHPAGAAYISRVVSKRGLGFGFQGVGGNLGVAMGPILAGVIASSMGWRAAYFIYTIPCLILVGLLLFSRPDTTPQIKVATASKRKVPIRPFVLSLALITGAQLMNGFIYRGVVTFLPTYFGERIHLNLLNMDSTLLAGSFTTIALLFGVIGQFFSGYLCEKMRREILAVIVPLATIPLLLIIGNSTELLLIITASIFAFFHFMGQPVYNNLIADYSPADWRGTMYGIYYFCTFGIGSFSATISGYIADKFGINQVFLVSAGFGLISLAAALVILIRALRASKRRQTNTEIT